MLIIEQLHHLCTCPVFPDHLSYDVGRDRVRRMMRRMGIEALYIKPRLSLAHPEHVKYPYLLRDLKITRANHVWATDIT
ncbi:MAG: hypothetical protein JRD69_09635, partial [Deltaproteobacteria bacterium]|nr:hypothetical protein [Deltaproteobacteria bacterium]